MKCRNVTHVYVSRLCRVTSSAAAAAAAAAARGGTGAWSDDANRWILIDNNVRQWRASQPTEHRCQPSSIACKHVRQLMLINVSEYAYVTVFKILAAVTFRQELKTFPYESSFSVTVKCSVQIIIIIIIIIITISKTMFMVLSSWLSHCESSPGSFDLMNVEWRQAAADPRPSQTT